MRDMAPQAAKKQRPRPRRKSNQADNVVEHPTTRAARLKQRAAESDAPLLELFQPNPADYSRRPEDRWWDILRSILDHTDITVDILSARSGVSRANLYHITSPSEGPRDVSMSKLAKLADALGFDPRMWMLPLDEFWAKVRSDNPGYRYDWEGFEPGSGGPSGGSEGSTAESTWIEGLRVA